MSICIDQNKCVGCGACTEVCPGNLIFVSPLKQTVEPEKNSVTARKVARLRDVRDCWGCTACVKACRRQAIAYYLAADLGGAGAKLFAVDEKQTLTWKLEFPDGSEQSIVVDKTQSNRY